MGRKRNPVKIAADGGRVIVEDEMPLRATLEHYSMFLTKHGYMDEDWRSEEPFAIDRYIEQLRKETKKIGAKK